MLGGAVAHIGDDTDDLTKWRRFGAVRLVRPKELSDRVFSGQKLLSKRMIHDHYRSRSNVICLSKVSALKHWNLHSFEEAGGDRSQFCTNMLGRSRRAQWIVE